MTTSTEQLATETNTLTGDYTRNPSHSRLGFAAKHAMVATVRGQFKVWSGTVHLDQEHPENSHAEVETDATSINTGNEDRDTHLRTGDFFDVATYPKITFASTSAEKL